MKRLLYIPSFYLGSLFILICCCTDRLSAQTNISGVVNSYYQVVEVIPLKACIRVSNISGLIPNKRVLLVQMKGASFLTTNSTAFGDTTSTNEAGFYEAGTICAINGDSVFLFHNLLHPYNPSTGKVQLVAFAEYTSANVTDTLKATPWNNSTGTGGVIALFADLDIALNAPIYADAAGFSGGSVVVSNSNCFNAPLAATNYAYAGANTAPQNGAYKGEGIADIAASQNGGRGPLINGGGGGNNHNNSGGGGANLSAGGAGGGNSSTAGCTTTLKGLGGKPLKNWGGEKIFLGGGGGAGHNNNGLLLKGGGNGGGIIFIWSNSITGNNNLISANGGAGGNSQSDGAGGGGAGGTIILAVNSYNGGLTVEANGGKGGDSDDGGNIGRCFGGGGGGSGGAVYFTGALPPVTVTTNGGAAGAETGRDPGCAAIQAATAGSNGSVISNYTFSRSTSNAGYCALLLPSKLIAFNCLLYQDQVLLKWEILNPELVAHFTMEKSDNGTNWMRLFEMTALSIQESYISTDPSVTAGKSYYRLRITEKTGIVYYSPVRQLMISSPDQGFTIWPNPASRMIRLYRHTAGSAMVNISDGNGKNIYRTTVIGKLTELSLPVMAPGIYYIQVNGSVQKLLIR